MASAVSIESPFCGLTLKTEERFPPNHGPRDELPRLGIVNNISALTDLLGKLNEKVMTGEQSP